MRADPLISLSEVILVIYTGHSNLLNQFLKCFNQPVTRASDLFQDWWAEVTHGAKNRGSFSEMMGPSISN